MRKLPKVLQCPLCRAKFDNNCEDFTLPFPCPFCNKSLKADTSFGYRQFAVSFIISGALFVLSVALDLNSFVGSLIWIGFLLFLITWYGYFKPLKLKADTGIQADSFPPDELVQSLKFTLPEWTEAESGDGMRRWCGPGGSILSLAAGPSEWAVIHSDAALIKMARELATAREAGLIEVNRVHRTVSGIRLIYKRLQGLAYVYTGMFLFPVGRKCLVWTVVAGEHGVTGLREATVTRDLINSGNLTIEEYKESFAQDPYDKHFCGVDRRVLRFMSDSEEYDARFPDHPLSRVRSVLTDVSKWVETQFQG